MTSIASVATSSLTLSALPQDDIPGVAQMLFVPWRVRRLPGAGPSLAGLRGLDDQPEPWRGLLRSLWPTLPVGAGAQALAGLQLHLLPQSAALPQLEDEAWFRLECGQALIRVEAASPAALCHALHALSEAWHGARARGATQWPAMCWEDAPRYPWRGLMVDVVRRPLPLEELLRLLDRMAAARLNVLHWHLTDDQAWRLESACYPRLHQIAGADFHFTLEQARTLVQEAAWRGIRVVPELDLPGHCWALGLAYPELLCPPAPQVPQRGYGVFPCAVDPESDALYTFLDRLIGEWAEVFPDRYIHMGGDELAPQAWQALALERGSTVARLQQRYVSSLGAILNRHQRCLVAWDELAEAADSPLPAGSVLQAWRGESALRFQPDPALGRLRSAGYYLDQVHPLGWRWRARPTPPAPVTPPVAGTAWRFCATLGCWELHGRLWLGEPGAPRLALRSSGTLPEGLAPQQVPDALHHWRVCVDSDLGELELWGPLRSAVGPTQLEAAEPLLGWLRQGNLRVPCQWCLDPLGGLEGWPVEPTAPPPAALGGEAALWSELIEAPQLTLRSGTGLLAVAHRLWADPDPAAMSAQLLSARVFAAQGWMRATGRLPLDPQGPLLQRLAPGQTEVLRALSLWLEPGAGYARQHAKKLQGRYDQDEALDAVVDALPPESPLMAELGDDAAAWLRALEVLQTLLPLWAGLALPARLGHVLESLAGLGQCLWRSDAALSREQALNAQCLLHESAALVEEMVPACINPLQRRLDTRVQRLEETSC